MKCNILNQTPILNIFFSVYSSYIQYYFGFYYLQNSGRLCQLPQNYYFYMLNL